MAIKPVEYIKDSSTVGFAEAGDKKQITKTNANTIQKDVDQGNTKDLDNAQTKYLDGNVDYDNLDYSEDEMYKVGTQQLDADNTEDAKNGNAVGTMVGSAAGSAAVGVANSVGSAIHGNMVQNAHEKVIGEMAKGLKMDSATGKITQTNGDNVRAAAENADRTSKIPFGAVIAGGIALAGAAMGLASVNKFDDQYKERISKRDSAEETNAVMQQYMETLNADMDMMNEDVTMYEELSAMQTTAQVETISDLGAMQAELQVYQAQGNTAKVAEMKGKMDNVKKTSEEAAKGPQEEMNGLKENIETYAGNNAEASGVRDSATSVSEFLKGGKGMGAQAAIQATMLTVSALLMLKGTINAATAALKAPLLAIPAAIACSIAGAAMLVAANVTTGIAAYKMFDKMNNEFKCSDAGDNMGEQVNELTTQIEGQAGFTEATSGTYGEADEASTETVAKNQEAADKANSKDKKNASKTKSTSNEGFGFSSPASKGSGSASGSSSGSGSTTSSPTVPTAPAAPSKLV